MAAGIDNVFIGLPYGVGQGVCAKILPDIFSGIKFWSIGRQLQQHDIFGDDELWGFVPAGAIEDHQGDSVRADIGADFDQMLVHGVDADIGHDQGGAGPARWADRAEEVGPEEAAVPLDAGPGPALGPDTGQRAMLTDASFVLEPHLNRASGEGLGDGVLRQRGEVFLKVSWASRSLSGWSGRAEMLL